MNRPQASLLCFSHLRWSFVYQRPQQVLSRIARRMPVIFCEEPAIVSQDTVALLEETPAVNVTVLRPQIPPHRNAQSTLRGLIDDYLEREGISPQVLWYYTPMALEFSRHLPGIRVYDCMDELSAFANAPRSLRSLEQELFSLADVVFTGGRSLYYSKRKLHGNVHCFPSAVDAQHFQPAGRPQPEALRGVGKPRIGFYGVIDERLDIDYVARLAELLPDWNLVLVGPVVKIDPSILPRRENIHYVGMQAYDELPALLEHWDVAFLPFARNQATRFISPTKTLEYLAAGKPVISTPIADVVDPYGEQGLVHIASSAHEAARIIRKMERAQPDTDLLRAARIIVEQASWQNVVSGMLREIDRLGEPGMSAAI